jgi:hypothetical protein
MTFTHHKILVNTHYRDDAGGNHQIKFVPAKLSDHMKPHIRSTKLHIRISEERTVPQSRHGRGWVLLQIISGFIEFDINSSTRILPSCWRALFCPIAPSALLIPEGRFLDGAREAFMKSMEGGVVDTILQRQLEAASTSMALGEDS